MVDRTFLQSHPKYRRDNFYFIIKTFLDDYPINFIFDTIKVSIYDLQLRSLLKHRTLKQTDKSNIDNKTTS